PANKTGDGGISCRYTAAGSRQPVIPPRKGWNWAGKLIGWWDGGWALAGVTRDRSAERDWTSPMAAVDGQSCSREDLSLAMPITLLDIILIGVMLVSALLAMIRGFMREVLSIAAWVIAAVVTLYSYAKLLP